MVERRTIRVLVTPTRTQYWVDRGRQTGAEYEMVHAFEERLNKGYAPRRHLKVSVIFIPTSRGDLIPALLDGRGDIAVGILTSRLSAWPRRISAVPSTGESARSLSPDRSRRP